MFPGPKSCLLSSRSVIDWLMLWTRSGYRPIMYWQSFCATTFTSRSTSRSWRRSFASWSRRSRWHWKTSIKFGMHRLCIFQLYAELSACFCVYSTYLDMLSLDSCSIFLHITSSFYCPQIGGLLICRSANLPSAVSTWSVSNDEKISAGLRFAQKCIASEFATFCHQYLAIVCWEICIQWSSGSLRDVALVCETWYILISEWQMREGRTVRCINFPQIYLSGRHSGVV